MRISRDLIQSSTEKTNPLKERMLILRGYKISVIENMGLIPQYIESLDFTDNDLIKLENFPPMSNIVTIMASNNLICRIDPGLAEALPKLRSLILTNNKIETLCDLVPLFGLRSLERLSLIENSVISLKYYREFLIHSIPSLRVLDFNKIKAKDREEAAALFSGPTGQSLYASIAPPRSESSSLVSPLEGMDANAAKRGRLLGSVVHSVDEATLAKKRKIEQISRAILNAKSVEETEKLKIELSQL